MILVGQDGAVAKWVFERTGGEWFGDGTTIASVKGDRIVAGAVYEDYNKASIRAHLAGDGMWAKDMEFIRFGFYYPFVQLGVNKLIGLVSSTNTRAIRLNQHFGYVQEAVIKGGCPDGDMIIHTMTLDQCRVLRGYEYDGEKQRSRRARLHGSGGTARHSERGGGADSRSHQPRQSDNAAWLANVG